MKTNFAQRQTASRVAGALDAIGGEPLAGSGFEKETPDGGFSGSSIPLGNPERLVLAARDVSGLSTTPPKEAP
jgi:hypothetical protein